MTLESDLTQRANGKCELCSSEDELAATAVAPKIPTSSDHAVLICAACVSHANRDDELDDTYFRFLADSMWTEHAPVKVFIYRLLKRLHKHDLVEQMYLDEEEMKWALDDPQNLADDQKALDSNGKTLMAGDTVTLIKDLVVKGANFTAKRGTTVKNISLSGDPRHVEGRVNGTKIVLVAAFLKKV